MEARELIRLMGEAMDKAGLVDLCEEGDAPNIAAHFDMTQKQRQSVMHALVECEMMARAISRLQRIGE